MAIDEDFLTRHTQILCDSYRRWTGIELLAKPDDKMQSQALWEAPFAVLSHGLQTDPVFNYSNEMGLKLFGYEWDELMQIPSRYSAEAMDREARDELLARVTAHGYVDDYTGVRITKNGQRFMIQNATVWNLMDEMGNYYGQAALISNWQFLEE